jgi:hypothetical protein
MAESKNSVIQPSTLQQHTDYNKQLNTSTTLNDYVQFTDLLYINHIANICSAFNSSEIAANYVTNVKNNSVSTVPLYPAYEEKSIQNNIVSNYGSVSLLVNIGSSSYDGIVQGTSYSKNYWKYYLIDIQLVQDNPDNHYYLTRILVSHSYYSELTGYNPTVRGLPWYWNEQSQQHYYLKLIDNKPHIIQFLKAESIDIDKIKSINFPPHNSQHCILNNANVSQEFFSSHSLLHRNKCYEQTYVHLAFLLNLAVKISKYGYSDLIFNNSHIAQLIDTAYKTILPNLLFKHYNKASLQYDENENLISDNSPQNNANFFALVQSIVEQEFQYIPVYVSALSATELFSRLQSLLPSSSDTEEFIINNYFK